MGLQYENLFKNDEASVLMRRSLYKEDTNVLAYYVIKNFVGQSVPIIDENKIILGIVTESHLYTELLKAEKVREDEELAD